MNPGIFDDVVLPEAEGGQGEFTYSLTGVPEGLSFDADSRTLSGTLEEAGEHTLLYTATDEAGIQASFSFTITVRSTRTARSTQEDINWRRPNIRNLHVRATAVQRADGPGLHRVLESPGHVQRHVR